MVGQVGLNTSVSSVNPLGFNPLGTTNPMASGLLNFSGNTLLGNNYEDDIMMPDSLKLNKAPASYAPGQTTPLNPVPQQTQQNPAPIQQLPFTSNTTGEIQTPAVPAPSQEVPQNINEYTAAPDKNYALTANGNPYNKTNFGKKTFAVLGFLSPMAGKVVKLCKGGSFKQLFNLKQLGIACPAIALAGLGVGALLDGYTNSKRATAADQAALVLNSQIQQPLNMLG